jgi:hypothetical protein
MCGCSQTIHFGRVGPGACCDRVSQQEAEQHFGSHVDEIRS